MTARSELGSNARALERFCPMQRFEAKQKTYNFALLTQRLTNVRIFAAYSLVTERVGWQGQVNFAICIFFVHFFYINVWDHHEHEKSGKHLRNNKKIKYSFQPTPRRVLLLGKIFSTFQLFACRLYSGLSSLNWNLLTNAFLQKGGRKLKVVGFSSYSSRWRGL